MPGKTEIVLRVPVHGFAKHVDDTVARATAILRAKEDRIPKESLPVPAHPTKSKVARGNSH